MRFLRGQLPFQNVRVPHLLHVPAFSPQLFMDIIAYVPGYLPNKIQEQRRVWAIDLPISGLKLLGLYWGSNFRRSVMEKFIATVLSSTQLKSKHTAREKSGFDPSMAFCQLKLSSSEYRKTLLDQTSGPFSPALCFTQWPTSSSRDQQTGYRQRSRALLLSTSTLFRDFVVVVV